MASLRAASRSPAAWRQAEAALNVQPAALSYRLPEAAATADAPLAPTAVPSPAITSPAVQPDLGKDVVAAPAATTLEWTAQNRTLVNRVNREINQKIIEQSDQATYGVADYWAAPTLVGSDRYGDCEDYALKKREQLIAAGVPAAVLSLAIVRTRRNEAHVVLLVSTDRGEFVLDNLSAWVSPWTEVGYLWETRQTPGDAFHWVNVGASQTLASAARNEVTASLR